MGNKLRLRHLLNEYLNNRLDLNEFSELFELLRTTDRTTVQQFLDELSESDDPILQLDIEKRIAAVHQNLITVIQQLQNESPLPQPLPIRRQWGWIAVGAIAASLLVFFGLRLFQHSGLPIDHVVQETVVAGEAMPGANKAILEIGEERHTLDGSKEGILLGTSAIRYNDGTDSDIAIADNATLIGLRTPRGGQYAAVMPDGTKIWLNAATQLKYKTSYGKTDRIIELTGEAYFEVRKNATLPFIVRSNGQEIKVLGTSFNVNAYQDDKVFRTTLVEGSLLLSTATGSLPVQPNEQVSWDLNTRTLDKTKIDVSQALAWKDGLIDLHGMSLQEAMKMIGRWYDRDIVYTGKVPDVMLGGKMSRGVRLSVFLKFLKQNFNIETAVKEDRIIIQDI